MGRIGEDHPETRLEVIDELVSLLTRKENTEANGAIVGRLAALKAVEAADDVKQAFEHANKIDVKNKGSLLKNIEQATWSILTTAIKIRTG